MSSKLSKHTAFVHITSHTLDTIVLALLYKAIISPCCNYCVEVCGNIYKTNLFPLFIAQKKLFALFAMLSIWITLLDCFINYDF